MSANDKYINGKIYKISSPSTNCKSLISRLSGHKRDYNNYTLQKRDYISSFEVVKYNDCIIELLEAYPCDNQTALRIREDFYIKSNPNAVNLHGAYQSPEEKRQYKIDYCNNYNKSYLEKNKDKLNAEKREKITCETCEVVYSKGAHARHIRSQTHLDACKPDYTTEMECDTCHIRHKISEHEAHLQSYAHLSLMEVECDVCGVVHQVCRTSKHIKSKIHLDALNGNHDVLCDLCSTNYKVNDYEKHIKMAKHTNFIIVNCDICNISYQKVNTKDHLNSKFHLHNVAQLNIS